MKSPVTGNMMERKIEQRKFEYRKDEFIIVFNYYLCTDSGEQFTDEALDMLNLNQVHNQYRAKYGIPFIEEIKHIRTKYDLSAVKMSAVLGLGANIYRNYEAGEMPSVANGRLIRVAEESREFVKLLAMGKNALEEHEYEKVQKKIDHYNNGWQLMNAYKLGWLFGSLVPDVYNGYIVPNLEKASRMVQFFALKNKPFTTALNKLMFYADFGHYKEYGYSISGLTYKAITNGPVPADYGKIYNEVVNQKLVTIKEVLFDAYAGEQFYCKDKDVSGQDIFLASELRMLQKVSDKFKGWTTKKIINASHTEKAWQHNSEDFDKISYAYSFELHQL